MGPVLLGGVAITVVGLLDDLRELSAKLRLGLTSAIIAAVLLTTGAGLGLVDALLVPLHLSAPDAIVVPISFVVSILVVLGACNSTNLIDGLDGLCSGVTAIVSLGFFFLAANLAAVGFSQEGDPARLVLAIAMFGAAVGFLPLNFNPARIFMGDAGSMLLGFNCGMMILLFAERGILRWVLGGLMVFALPVADTALAIVRRWRSGRPIFAGDRSHFYDQLVDRGISVRKVVAISYVVAAFYAVMGCLSIWLRTRYVLPLYLLVAVATVVTLSALKMMKVEPRSGISGRARTLRLLFTSAGRRVSLIHEFRRAAEELGVKLRIYAADCQAMAPALQTADQAVLVPEVRAHDYCDRLLDYARAHEIDALIPLIDPELQLLSEASGRFAEAGTRVIISSPEVIRISVDKVRTGEFLQQHGFLAPGVLTDKDFDSPTFPLFIKPRDGSSSLGAHKIDSPQDLAYYRGLYPGSIVQEFIEGVEYTVDVFADFQGCPRCAVPRRRHEVRGGEVSKSQAVQNLRMMKEHCRLVEALGGCRGMITIQCFLTPKDEIVFIEINPRFGGGVPLSIAAGADSPRWIIEGLLGREPSVAMAGWTDGMLMLRYDRGIFVLPEDLPRQATTEAMTSNRGASEPSRP
jgi:carbamoyl-phosphate synthase large subunit